MLFRKKTKECKEPTVEEIEWEIFSIEQDIQKLRENASLLREKRDAIINKNHKRKYITDHAIVRYLERVKGVDIDSICNEIIDDNMIRNINTGAILLQCSGGHELRCKNNKITTIISRNQDS